MPENNNINVFALLKDGSIRRIPTTGNLQTEMTAFWQTIKESFHTDEDEVDFSGNYNIDKGEIYKIDDFPMPEVISAAINNPLNNDILNLEQEGRKIAALFAGKWPEDENERYVSFQSFDSGKLLKKGGITVISSGQNYTKLEDPGLIIGDKLTSLFVKDKLLFYSYYVTRRFLNLDEYYREATDEELDSFASNDLINISDLPSFKDGADSIIRKKIALIESNGLLANLNLTEATGVARNYNVAMTVQNGKIIIPQNRKEIKKLLHFLNEDYFTTPLTQKKCITNSKKYLQ